MQTVTLEGGARYGVDVPQTYGALKAAAELPLTVCLGRVQVDAAPAKVLRLAKYFGDAFSAPPVSVNRRDKAAAALSRVLLNDRLGCCVIAGKYHALGIYSANDSDSGGIVIPTDNEVLAHYNKLKAGPGDSGCIITDVLSYMVKTGFSVGGSNYKLDGYVAADNTSQAQVKAAQYLFGAGTFGIDLPRDWTQNAVWDVTSSPVVGGHDVTPHDYDERGVYVSSWGRTYLMTWRAVLSRQWVKEYYCLLAPLWYGSDRLAPSGVNADALRADLAVIKGGGVPDVNPNPPAPPPPPVPAGNPISYLIGYDKDNKQVARFDAKG